MNSLLAWIGQPSSFSAIPFAVALGLAVLGMWLRFAQTSGSVRRLGGLLALVSFAILALAMPRFGGWLDQLIFWASAGIAVAAAGAAITSRNPVYVAIWFALSLLGTAGLFLFQGAQFLGAATIVVYAGAIVVTFLFVIMLAQPQGLASYDRVSWAWFTAPVALLGGAALTAFLLLSPGGSADSLARRPAAKPASVADNQHHMAKLGTELFTRHLVSVEVAGTLLLAALVGAVVIATHARTPVVSHARHAQPEPENGGSSVRLSVRIKP